MNFFRGEKEMQEYISNLVGVKDTIYALDLDTALKVAEQLFASELFMI